MRVLILGASGMLGHKLLQRLADRFEVWGTLRGRPDAVAIAGVAPERLIGGVQAERLDTVAAAIERVAPQAVVNCIGIVKQLAEAKDPVLSISVNALFPHQLARLCQASGARLVHMSTDCVFSGRGGPYTIDDVPDPVDLYGRSKLLGEVDDAHCVTLRTSIVGRELGRGTGLIEWFLAQDGGQVRGFRRALYSGLTTQAMAEVIAMVLLRHPRLSGVWQVAADAINKWELLRLVARVYDLRVTIDVDDDFVCDRRLDGSPFREATGLAPPSWVEMIEEMRADPLL